MSETGKSLEQVEKEQMTRRQALRKFGFGAGLSAFMLLGVDDLARMVGDKMQQMNGDNKVANQIAKEFQSAGIVLAAGGPSGCTPNLNCAGCSPSSAAACCIGSSNQFLCCSKSVDPAGCCSGVTGVAPYLGDPEAYDECMAYSGG